MIVSRHWHRRFLWAYFPPYRWWRNSHLYYRWMMWRWRRSMRRLEKMIGQKFIPAMQNATKAMVAWNEAWKRVGAQKDDA